jgi:DNA-binding transcriptional LysR family regulator
MFELSQLRCFAAVAEELHFGRAAARLNMTQPPLSRQIQILEHALGVGLFERTSRSVRLTPAGHAFLTEARHLLQLAEGAGLAAKRVARGEAGSVTIGLTAATSYGFLPRLIAFARSEMPKVDLVLREMVTADQMEALASSRIDLGLVRLPIDRRGVEAVCVAREPLLVAIPKGHRLASGREPTLEDLDRQPLVMYSPVEGRYFYDLLAGLFQAAKVSPNYVQYISQTHTILALVSAGIGLAVVPEAARNLHFEGAVLRPLRTDDVRAASIAELYLVWRRHNPNPAAKVFHELILKRFTDAAKGRRAHSMGPAMSEGE